MIIGRSSGLWKTSGTPLSLTFVREGQFVADGNGLMGMQVAKPSPWDGRLVEQALFYLSVSLGTARSGELARCYTAENEGTYFGALGGIAIGIGALLAVASPWVLKLMPGVR
jgi:POT family proton-dependent oligopeptide transporter